MKIKYNYLKDKNFLKQLTRKNIKQYFAKIIILNWKEEPLQDIQGKVLSGNISIDGKSSIRRTANLILYVDKNESNINSIKNIISINKKICMQIGFLNDTDQYLQYNMLWFPQGTYIITDISLSYSSEGLTMSLSLKDKMCLLNGECGGTFPASTKLDTYQTIDSNGNVVVSRPTIYKIIQQVVNHFGKQQLGKIIISDLDEKVRQVMRWTGSTPLYILKKDSQYIITSNTGTYQNYKSKNYEEIIGNPFGYNRDVGYVLTDFTYPGELIAAPGDSVVTILEKIKQVLGNYEFFYDIQGNFIFQEIKNFVNKTEAKYFEEQKRANFDSDLMYFFDFNGNKISFQLENDLILSYNNNPQYANIKNDFIIWGARKNSGNNGKSFLRYHLAIDSKPAIGVKNYNIIKYYDELQDQYKWTIAKNKEELNEDDEEIKMSPDYIYIDSKGKYYRLQWDGEKYTEKEQTVVTSDRQLKAGEIKKINNIKSKDWRTELLFQGMQADIYGQTPNDYYAELLAEWPKIYDIEKGKFFDEFLNNPSEINYFLDFIDSQELEGLSVQNIGRRSFVVDRGTNINCVFQPYIPDLVLIGINSINQPSLSTKELKEECEKRGLNYYQLQSTLFNGLEVGGVLNSAYEEIRQELNKYTQYNESISITTLPIFYLQPNTLITINNKESNIFGEYLINSLSFSLGISSQLSINATKNITKE